MRRFVSGLYRFLKDALNPPLHQEAERAARQADKVEKTSEKLIAQADNFGTMIKGMRGELQRKSSRSSAKRK